MAGLLLAGLVLLACTLPSKYVFDLGPFEGLARSLYRIAFFLRLPVFMFVSSFTHQTAYHWPAWVDVVTCLIAPSSWYAVWWLGRRLPGVGCKSAGGLHMVTRRRFLASSAGAAGLGGYAVLVEPNRILVQTYRVPVRGLPESLAGTRLIHLSDTHYGPFMSKAYLERACEQANALDGDLVILTGDYIHRTPLAIEPGIGLLAGLEARFGALAVLGNHDHWEGAPACRAVFSEIGIPLIDNDRRFLTPTGVQTEPEPGHSLCIAGVGDLWAGRVSFDDALNTVPEGVPRIVLSHNPDVAETMPPGHRVDLMCSGHTHGGQVRLPALGTPIVPSRYGSKYAGGLVQGPHCRVLVSRGVGMAVLPVRFRVRPELVVIELVRESSPA